MANVAASWHRSFHEHGIDRWSCERPRVLTPIELKDHHATVEELLAIAQEEIGHLYSVVGKLGYAVLLASPMGAVVDCRGNPADADQFSFWGLRLGALWSEDVEGTNGIGTAIAEEHPVTIHRTQHFRARHARLSCSAATIFDPQAKLAAVLNVASINPEVSDRAHAMALVVASDAAQAVAQRLFRHRFRGAWNIAMMPRGGTRPAMLAVDNDHRIVGADRNARVALALDDRSLAGGIYLWTIFQPDSRLLRQKAGHDVSAQLTHAASKETWQVLVTAPLIATRHRSQANLHARPRTGFLEMPPGTLSSPHKGGLPAAALLRVQDYIGAHIDQKVSLRTLAKIAGFSLYHFAREFRNSVGVAPHLYILQARIDQARRALINTDAPITEIAAALGFSDASRFANQFRRTVGMTPSAFRRERR